MAFTVSHPSYTAAHAYWTICRDFYEGEQAVKAKGTTYLPMTKAQRYDWNYKENGSDKSVGELSYDAMLMRAGFFDGTRMAVESYLGMLQQKPASFLLPDSMMYLLSSASNKGDKAASVLSLINAEQLQAGRGVLFVDFKPGTNTLPYVCMYVAEAFINWADDDVQSTGTDTKLIMAVLNESGNYFNLETMQWEYTLRFRHLQIRNGVYCFAVTNDANPGSVADDAWVEVSYNGKTFDTIPLFCFNVKDCNYDIDLPPLLPLVNKCATIYRTEADYRDSLHQQGQDTLVVKGMLKSQTALPNEPTPAVRVGTGAMIELDRDGDAKMIGVTSTGLPEQRMALEKDKQEAMQMAGQLALVTNNKEESGASLQTRLGAQTSILQQIAITGAEAFEKGLRFIATMFGENPTKVSIIPNTEFIHTSFLGQDLLTIVQSAKEGAPLSRQSIHQLCRKRGLTTMTFDEEEKAIEDDPIKLVADVTTNTSSNPAQPV